jgi:hypothetical protein
MDRLLNAQWGRILAKIVRKPEQVSEKSRQARYAMGPDRVELTMAANGGAA